MHGYQKLQLASTLCFVVILQSSPQYVSPANGEGFGGGGFDGGGFDGGGFDGGNTILDDNALDATVYENWSEWTKEPAEITINPFLPDGNPLLSDDQFDPYDPAYPDNPFGLGNNQHCGPASACGGEPTGPIPNPTTPAPSRTVPTVPYASTSILANNLNTAEDSSNSGETYPRAVALEYSNNRILCSGVVVSDQYLLTAAHCACGDPPVFAIIGRTAIPDGSPAGFFRKIELSFDAPIFYKNNFCETYLHTPLAAMQGGDAALIKFTTPLQGDIRQVLLPVDDISTHDFQHTTVHAVGWGESDNSWRPGVKNYTKLELTSRLCTDADQASYGCSSGLESIAANPPNDTCFADSGGPVYIMNSEGDMQLIAITSRSLEVTDHNLCGSGGIYTSLESTEIRDWLLHATSR